MFVIELVQKEASPVPTELRRSLTFVLTLLMTLNRLGVPESRHEGRLCRKGTLGKKLYLYTDGVSFKKARYVVLQHFSLVDTYIEEHKYILCSKFPEKFEVRITRKLMDTFTGWLRKHLVHNMDVSEQLFLLARGPS